VFKLKTKLCLSFNQLCLTNS